MKASEKELYDIIYNQKKEINKMRKEIQQLHSNMSNVVDYLINTHKMVLKDEIISMLLKATDLE